jgi:hypothetical protein
MTIWHFIILALLAIEVGLCAWDISKVGSAAWFRQSMRESGFQYLGKRFRGPWRIIVPIAQLLVVMLCLFEIALHRR